MCFQQPQPTRRPMSRPILVTACFTYVIREGLDGQADTDLRSVGIISFEELADYVGRRVRQLSSAHRIRMEPDVPILDQDMDFPLAEGYSRQQLSLHVQDETHYYLSPLPGRVAWWKGRIERLDKDISVISTDKPGIYRLGIVEINGTPSRSRLSISGSGVLGEWKFSEISVEDMLQAMTDKLSHNYASAACSSKGLTSSGNVQNEI